MITKQVNIGRVLGYSTYELAVRTGKFTGTLEEFLAKEMTAYELIVEYGDALKAFIESAIAGITDGNNVDLAELIAARSTYNTLNDRLCTTDDQLDIILERLNAIDPALIGAESIRISGIDKNIELRNNGLTIQWRFIGYTNWEDLVSLSDLTPNFQIGTINVVDNNDDVDVTIGGTRKNPLLNFNLPKGKDGVDGGDIISGRINDAGELILTVRNNSTDTDKDVDDNEYIMPVLTVGTVETLDEDAEAYVILSGSPTNPVLNFGIPKGKSTKVKSANKDEDGVLHFVIE